MKIVILTAQRQHFGVVWPRGDDWIVRARHAGAAVWALGQESPRLLEPTGGFWQDPAYRTIVSVRP